MTNKKKGKALIWASIGKVDLIAGFFTLNSALPKRTLQIIYLKIWFKRTVSIDTVTQRQQERTKQKNI